MGAIEKKDCTEYFTHFVRRGDEQMTNRRRDVGVWQTCRHRRVLVPMHGDFAQSTAHHCSVQADSEGLFLAYGFCLKAASKLGLAPI